MFEWDETKRRTTLEKHGLDFLDVIEVFATPYLDAPAQSDIEDRRLAIGVVNGIEIAVIYVMRGETIRIITARRARRNERAEYHGHLARRSEAQED